jgi:hypothetical protein
MAGNPNPSPETRFKPGNNANPGGKSAELKAIEAEAAVMAAKFRHAALSAMTEKLNGVQGLPKLTADQVLEMVTSDILRLAKDSEDRAYGTPRASVDHTSADGSMTPDQGSGAAKILQALESIAKRSGTTGEPAP